MALKNADRLLKIPPQSKIHWLEYGRCTLFIKNRLLTLIRLPPSQSSYPQLMGILLGIKHTPLYFSTTIPFQYAPKQRFKNQCVKNIDCLSQPINYFFQVKSKCIIEPGLLTKMEQCNILVIDGNHTHTQSLLLFHSISSSFLSPTTVL